MELKFKPEQMFTSLLTFGDVANLVSDWRTMYAELAATRSAAGPDAQGWRLLDYGEEIQEGDELWSCREKVWYPADNHTGDSIYKQDVVRRRLPAAPTVTAEARAWLDPNTGMVSGYPGGPYTVALVPAAPAVGDVGKVVEAAWNDAVDACAEYIARNYYPPKWKAEGLAENMRGLKKYSDVAVVTALGKGGE